jgi:hypothetical protein
MDETCLVSTGGRGGGETPRRAPTPRCRGPSRPAPGRGAPAARSAAAPIVPRSAARRGAAAGGSGGRVHLLQIRLHSVDRLAHAHDLLLLVHEHLGDVLRPGLLRTKPRVTPRPAQTSPPPPLPPPSPSRLGRACSAKASLCSRAERVASSSSRCVAAAAESKVTLAKMRGGDAGSTATERTQTMPRRSQRGAQRV